MTTTNPMLITILQYFMNRNFSDKEYLNLIEGIDADAVYEYMRLYHSTEPSSEEYEGLMKQAVDTILKDFKIKEAA